MEIRKFTPEDAEEVSNVIRRALALINSKDYQEDQIKSMIEKFSPQAVLERSQKRSMFVTIIDFKIVATGSLQNDTIYSLFVDPDYNGIGIGTKLMEYLEKLARSNHVKVLKVPSSITAIGFYSQLGYVEDKEAISEDNSTVQMVKVL